MIKKWQQRKNGRFDPYCQVAIQYLQKKLRRL